MNLGSLVVRIGADMSGVLTAFQKTETRTVQLGRQLQGVGKGLSTYVTAPILAMGALSVRAFDKQAKAVAAVENGIRSTGNAAGRTLQQLTAEASRLQQTSLFGDEEILTRASRSSSSRSRTSPGSSSTGPSRRRSTSLPSSAATSRARPSSWGRR